MAKIQYQEKNRCFVTTIPRDILNALGAKKGDKIHYNITETGEVKIIKIKDGEK